MMFLKSSIIASVCITKVFGASGPEKGAPAKRPVFRDFKSHVAPVGAFDDDSSSSNRGGRSSPVPPPRGVDRIVKEECKHDEQKAQQRPTMKDYGSSYKSSDYVKEGLVREGFEAEATALGKFKEGNIFKFRDAECYVLVGNINGDEVPFKPFIFREKDDLVKDGTNKSQYEMNMERYKERIDDMRPQDWVKSDTDGIIGDIIDTFVNESILKDYGSPLKVYLAELICNWFVDGLHVKKNTDEEIDEEYYKGMRRIPNKKKWAYRNRNFEKFLKEAKKYADDFADNFDAISARKRRDHTSIRKLMQFEINAAVKRFAPAIDVAAPKRSRCCRGTQ